MIADHLSRLTLKPSIEPPVKDSFPYEQLLVISSEHWFVDVTSQNQTIYIYIFFQFTKSKQTQQV